MELLRKAFALGEIEAASQLGDHFWNIDGGSERDKKAAYWYWRAASLGDYHAMTQLTEFYEQGIGVSPNLGKARFWACELANFRPYPERRG